jgi:hypothetical protein
MSRRTGRSESTWPESKDVVRLDVTARLLFSRMAAEMFKFCDGQQPPVSPGTPSVELEIISDLRWATNIAVNSERSAAAVIRLRKLSA